MGPIASNQQRVENESISFPIFLTWEHGVCAQSLSCVHVWLPASLWNIACQAPLSMEFPRQEYWILEWFAMSFSRGSSWRRDPTGVSWVSCIGRQILYHWATREFPLYSLKCMVCLEWPLELFQKQHISHKFSKYLCAWKCFHLVPFYIWGDKPGLRNLPSHPLRKTCSQSLGSWFFWLGCTQISELRNFFSLLGFLCFSFKIFDVERFWSLYWICYNIASIWYFALLGAWGMWDPSSVTRDWTHTPCIGRWSLNHWTTKDVLGFFFNIYF